jgi:hypothetical protein
VGWLFGCPGLPGPVARSRIGEPSGSFERWWGENPSHGALRQSSPVRSTWRRAIQVRVPAENPAQKRFACRASFFCSVALRGPHSSSVLKTRNIERPRPITLGSATQTGPAGPPDSAFHPQITPHAAAHAPPERSRSGTVGYLRQPTRAFARTGQQETTRTASNRSTGGNRSTTGVRSRTEPGNNRRQARETANGGRATGGRHPTRRHR